MCLHPNQVHVLLRHIHMCTLDNLTYPVRNSMRVHHTPRLSKRHNEAGASRTTVPGPTKVVPDGSDRAQKPVPFRVAKVLHKSRNAFREKPLFWKKRWRVSMHEGEEPLETCERGGSEAGRAERPIAATLEDGPQANSEAEETSLPGATAGQSESREHKRTL
ncbi:hypothetical protein E2C01_030585 [Portunus trituberculatus]|uniref:Uncharacterized protein n=1 Tax=Portunus trituberculatus TaxID=210409 RepID=A0A5B7EQT5_PORTR|nr:hypothetical protein [Portunus trituberculatus]